MSPIQDFLKDRNFITRPWTFGMMELHVSISTTKQVEIDADLK